MNRDKFNKQKVLDYVQRKFEDAKEMNMFKMFRKSVETGANGTQKYMVKHGKNKGKIL
mgnify:FL=1|jgi:hypothetical protein|tara:strand:+ start:63 stop:236 length:174 start_codon:yes stop_codon:yes gene_type:complete